jgi:hypothetical protein
MSYVSCDGPPLSTDASLLDIKVRLKLQKSVTKFKTFIIRNKVTPKAADKMELMLN